MNKEIEILKKAERIQIEDIPNPLTLEWLSEQNLSDYECHMNYSDITVIYVLRDRLNEEKQNIIEITLNVFTQFCMERFNLKTTEEMHSWHFDWIKGI
jgi:hypothetical protein